jgi:hypothetical protein
MPSEVAVYGTYEAFVPVRQRYWVVRNDGVKQRYWKNTTRTKKTVMKGRYEFSGSGKDLYKAVVEAHDTVPKGYIRVQAKQFTKNPNKYGYEGIWIDQQINS